MHIWLVKYSNNNFSPSFIAQANEVAAECSQLKNSNTLQKSFGKFHLLSFTTPVNYSQKVYTDENEKSINGYSGLLIGKNDTETDLRNINNIDVKQPFLYNGQFALFRLTEESFECWGDNFGFHKVFYGSIKGELFVTNSIELLKSVEGVEPNIEKMITDYVTIRFGVTPGYESIIKGFMTLPEYGNLKINNNSFLLTQYKEINELLSPNATFEEKLDQTINEFRTSGVYLRKYHHSVVPLSGGFDGRTILSFFYKTKGKPLETMTYNRAWSLDYNIAGKLSKAFGVPHHKIKISDSINEFDAKIPEYKSIKDDPFYKGFYIALKDFYKVEDSFKVSLGGNGADTDWEFGEKHLKSLDKTNFKSFVSTYAKLLSRHPNLNKDQSNTIAEKLENYFIAKYSVFEKKPNFIQLLASAFFHLERFRSEQGIVYSQHFNQKHDVFLPYATECFNQTVFLATKRQLNRGVREGINYRIFHSLTEGTTPYAPILTAKNEHGKNWYQRTLNNIAPILPKLVWKIRNGDTNGNLRKQYDAKINSLSKTYILANETNPLWDYLDRETVVKLSTKEEVNSNLNEIAKMLKFVEDINKK